jgi:hypothetical protein
MIETLLPRKINTAEEVKTTFPGLLNLADKVESVDF